MEVPEWDGTSQQSHILDTCALIFNSCGLLKILPQPHHVTTSHPLHRSWLGSKPQERAMGGPKEYRDQENIAPRNSII